MRIDWGPFWNSVHKTGYGLWLTDTPPLDYIKNLKLDLSEKLSIMEVGVGRGLMVKYLNDNGHDVTACDISPVALELLPADVFGVLVKDLPLLKTASRDLGISYLSAQHMDDDMLSFVIDQATRICGTFKFQMAEMIRPADGIKKYDGPMYMRPLDAVRCNAKLSMIGEMGFEQQNIRWIFVEAKCH